MGLEGLAKSTSPLRKFEESFLYGEEDGKNINLSEYAELVEVTLREGIEYPQMYLKGIQKSIEEKNYEVIDLEEDPEDECIYIIRLKRREHENA